MTNTRFQVYKSSVLQLAKTIVVKYSPVAEIINVGLYEKMLYNSTNAPMSQWKYYLNLSGQYHPTDRTMTIKSIENDTIEEIVFNRTNLKERPTTSREYYYGSRFYNDLVRRYPDQEMLILGILYPVVDDEIATEGERLSLEKVLGASDGDVLQFDTSLVEENETDLIPRVQDWIKIFLRRWNVPEYGITDDYYVSTMLGMLYLNLPTVIMNIRLDNCKTNRAHSFHIREFLESHGKLGRYLDVLNKKQALYLYRNLPYLQKHAGKQENFDKLIDILFTERNLPIAGFNVRHNLGAQPIETYHETELAREAINFRQVGTGSDILDPAYILDKEVAISRRAEMLVSEELVDLESKDRHSLSNRYSTKVVESSVIDTTDNVTYPLSEVLLFNWVYRATNGVYGAPVYVTNPFTGDRLVLNTKDAFILYVYCYTYANYKNGSDEPFVLEEIPTFSVRNIIRETFPTFEQLAAVVDREIIDDERLHKVLLNPPNMRKNFISTDAFYLFMVDIQQRMMDYRDLYVIEQDYRHRGYMEFAVNMIYKDVDCVLAPPGTLYEDWLQAKGFDFTEFRLVDYKALANELVRNGTGAGTNTSKSLRDLQAGMVDIMRNLSSYSVQILKTINNGNEIVLDAPALRVGNIKDKIHDVSTFSHPSTYAFEPQAKFITEADIVINRENDYFYQGLIKDEGTYEVGARINYDNNKVDRMDVRIPLTSVFFTDDPITDLATQITTTEIPDYGYS